MGFLVAIFLGLVFLAAIAGPIIYFQARKTFREQKNFERGLKMVPLLIHLPPLSEDIEGNGRDNRDIIEEHISQAQTMYDIIASTFKKGFKNNFYGQRHLAFEIVGHKGFVSFYAAVPVVLIDVVRQAIVSAYPTARLEEVAEHNIFSPVGKISGTVGGELSLKESFAYPIATYQELKRDGIQSLLNALSTLDKEDGAGIQIMFRPAQPGWRKQAHDESSKKRKGEKKKTGGAAAMWWVKQTVVALTKPPEDKSGDKGDKKDLSSLDQSIVDAIDDKTRYPGFEVMIRIVVSSNLSQRSQGILNNIVATFALFNAQGKNGFSFTPAKDMESFVTGYIMRFFPQQNNQNVLNTVELATLFHFPDQKNIPTTQLARQASKQVDGPRNMPDDGMLLGYNVFRGAKKPIRLSLEDRRRHLYAVGQTGTGKSTFLENMAVQDMMDGNGFAFIDPHGDTAEKLLAMVPKERTEDVIYFCPADMDYPLGLNMFEYDTEDQKDFLIQEAINMLEKLYDPNNQGIIGPRYHHLFRNAALTVMADPEGGTFIDIPKLFRDPEYVKQKLKYVTDPNVLEFWQKEMPQSQRSNEFGEVVSWFVSKFGAFLSNHMMRNIIGQTKSSLNLRHIMDNKKILIVNLSKGRTGDLNSKLLGMIFVMKFQAAAMSRSTIPEDERVDFCLYVDEFQNFSTESFATIMSEARKYRLNLIVANQFTTQLSEDIRDAVFGNMGTIVAYRIGQNDVEALSRYFQPLFDGDDLLRVPNFNAVVRTLISGVPTQPFSMAALPPLGKPDQKLFDALKQLSAAKFGRPRAVVDAEISERMKTIEPPKAAFGGAGARPFGPQQAGGSGSPAAPAAGAQQRPKPAGGSSFLDEWLAKRQAPAPPATPSVSSVAPPASMRGGGQTPPAGVPVPQQPQQAWRQSQPGQQVAQPLSVGQSQQPTATQPMSPYQQAVPQALHSMPSPAPVQETSGTSTKMTSPSNRASGVTQPSVVADSTPVVNPASLPPAEPAGSGVVHLRDDASHGTENTIIIGRE
jgi:hypothetical protein